MTTTRRGRGLLSAATLALAIVGGATHAAEPAPAGTPSDALFQVGTITALLNGVYDGDMTVAALAGHGNIGLGTFNQLDGELVALDAMIYRVGIDGTPRRVAAGTLTPFAVVAFFDADHTAALPASLTLTELSAHLDGLLRNANHFQAIRIDGTFDTLKLRSVPPQDRPYRRLAEVIDDQVVFQYRDVAGTLVGIRSLFARRPMPPRSMWPAIIFTSSATIAPAAAMCWS